MSIEVAQDNKYHFEDNLIEAVLYVSDDAINFQFENLTDHSIKIVWDEASFIDVDGSSSRVMHQGVEYIDRNSSQPPSVIPARGHITDFIVPTNRVWYKEGVYSRYSSIKGGWRHLGLIQPNLDLQKVQGTAAPPPTPDFEISVRNNEGKRFGFLLPLEIQGVVNEYTFWFKITESSIRPVRPFSYTDI